MQILNALAARNVQSALTYFANSKRLMEVDSAKGLMAKARIAAVRKDMTAEGALLRQAAEVQPASYRAIVARAGTGLSQTGE